MGSRGVQKPPGFRYIKQNQNSGLFPNSKYRYGIQILGGVGRCGFLNFD